MGVAGRRTSAERRPILKTAKTTEYLLGGLLTAVYHFEYIARDVV